MITMKRLDTALRVMTALLVLLLCLLSAAFASDETASGTDAEETSAPVMYEYDITITPPSGWYTDSADVTITIRDVYDTGWDSAVLLRGGEKTGISLTGERNTVSISDNGTYTVRVTDPSGDTHEASETVACFDTTAPAVTAGIRDKVLHCEASDGQSGVYGIMVDGNLYTTLHDGALDLRLEDYSGAGKTLSVTAIDNVGNRSPMTTIDNPYYSDATPAPAATNAPVIIYTGTENSGTSSTQTSTGTASVSRTTPVSASTTTTNGTSTTTAPTAATATPVPTKAPDTTADEPETSEAEEITIEPGTGFSQNGNAVTRDLLYDKHSNKQFITVQTRNGNTMYLVIDYDKVSDEDEEQYQTYFLNPVDEADLLALLDDDAISALTGSDASAEETPAVCTCDEKCAVGHIDTTCPVCRTDMSKCTGPETATPAPEPTETPEDPEPEPEPSGGKSGAILAVFLIFGAIGGGVFYFMKNKKATPKTAGDTDVFDYDYDEDEEMEENEEDPEHDRSRES